MYGDTTTIRRLADRMVAQGHELRDLATTLGARARSTPWQGRAAEAMRAGVATHAADLVRAADRHDQAAAALREHADAVDRVLALVAAIETAVRELVTAARDRIDAALGGLGALGSALGQVAGSVVDPVDRLLDRFVPPEPGSLDWLDVDLPGLPDPPWLPDLPGRPGGRAAA